MITNNVTTREYIYLEIYGMFENFALHHAHDFERATGARVHHHFDQCGGRNFHMRKVLWTESRQQNQSPNIVVCFRSKTHSFFHGFSLHSALCFASSSGEKNELFGFRLLDCAYICTTHRRPGFPTRWPTQQH
jgi:hypothetical protein